MGWIVYSLLVVAFIVLSAGIGNYILQREEEERDRIDKILDELIEEIERGKK